MIPLLALTLSGTVTPSGIQNQVPTEFQGRYTLAVGSCGRSGTPQMIIGGRNIEWFGRDDRVLFSEPIGGGKVHVFLTDSSVARGVKELHFELQGDRADHLLILDHLSDAEDVANRGTTISDKSVVGFFKRCA